MLAVPVVSVVPVLVAARPAGVVLARAGSSSGSGAVAGTGGVGGFRSAEAFPPGATSARFGGGVVP